MMHRTDFGKYSFVNRTIQVWNKLTIISLKTFPSKLITFRTSIRKVICEGKGIRSEGKLNMSRKWGWNVISEVNGFWCAGKLNICGEKIRKVLSEVKWRDFEVRRRSSTSKYRGWKVLSEVKWREMKCGEDRPNAVKWREVRRGEIWSVYKGCEVQWGWNVWDWVLYSIVH